MRKLIIGLLAVLTAAGTTLAAAPAEAATDRRACVTRTEYQAVHPGMSSTRVKGILDGTGTLLTDRVYGYYVGDWNWSDELGDYYWDDFAYYFESKDSVRAYKKCTAWGGGGRVGINFANYDTDGYYLASGRAVWEKVPNHAQAEADWIDAIYDELENGDYLSSSLAADSPSGNDDSKKVPQAPDGRRPAKPTEPPAGEEFKH